MERTEIKDLGEFALISKLTKDLAKNRPSTLLGVGDDAAVIDPLGKRVVVTTDMLVEGVHFDLSYVPLKHLGYKAVIANLSDVCAMNAKPTQILIGLGVSNRFSVEALEELYDGVKTACELYKVDLVGGDTTSSPSGLTLSITAVGLVDGDSVVTRGGASAGDLLVVSGDLGSAYMGLQVLEREKEVFKEAPKAQPDLQNHSYIIERQLKPEARTDIVTELSDLKVKPTSMIDISDFIHNQWLLLIIISISIVSLFTLVFRNETGRYWIDNSLLKIPLVGSVIMTGAMSQYSWSIASLLRSGLPVVETIQISAGLINNKAIAVDILKVAEQVLQGQPLSRSIKQPHITRLIQHMTLVGERSGGLVDIMFKAGVYYENELKSKAKAIGSMVEPVSILLIGGLVGFIYFGFFKAVFAISAR